MEFDGQAREVVKVEESLLKTIVFRIANAVPDEWACRMLPGFLLGSYIRWLVRMEKYKAACVCNLYAFRRKRQTNTASTQPKRNSLVVVAGPPRVGKSQFAIALAAELGLQVVHTDYFRPIYEKITDTPLRLQIKDFLFNKIVREWPYGVVLEGATFLGDNGRDDQLATALALVERHDACLLLVGCSGALPDEKAAMIEANAAPGLCWTTRLDPDQRRALAESIIKRSRALKTLAEERQLEYLEIGADEFRAGFRHTIERVIGTLK